LFRNFIYKSKYVVHFLLIGLYTLTIAKEKFDFITAVDAIYEHQQGSVSYEMLTECLWQFYQQPIDLNHTSKEELKKLHVLSESQLNNFFDHLNKNGVLVSMYELQAISEFDVATIKRLLPFVSVEELYPKQIQKFQKPSNIQPTYGYWLTRYERIFETAKGYEINEETGEIPYKGSSDRLVTRIKWNNPNGWGFGITARKYPGEDFTWHPSTERYGFNLYAGYIFLENKKWLKKLIIGNYQVGYGQGLVVNAGFSMDQSAETIPVMRTSNAGIKPHTSFSDAGFRGIATTLIWRNFEQSVYYAYNHLDGKVLQDNVTGECYTENIQRSGLYRTGQEIAKKAQIQEQIVGSTLLYTFNRNQKEIGLNAIYSQYHLPIRFSNKQLSYNFAGRENFNLSLFYRYLWHNMHFFGECGVGRSGGKAGVVGVVASLLTNVDFSLLVRYYEEDFHSFYGKAFRENASGNHNEQGIYVGIGVQPIRKLKINAYYDYFNFPQPTNTVVEPSSGYSWLTKVTYQINRNKLFLFQYKALRKAKNIPKNKMQYSKTTGKRVEKFTNRRYKTQFKQKLGKFISLHSEVQVSTYHFLEEFTWGYALVQNVTYKFNKFSLSGQIAWVDADFNNKLYIYEKATLYNKSMPIMYYRKGIKVYMMVGYKPAINWRIEAKYNVSWYPEEDHIGSGNEKVQGNIKNEVKLQLIYNF
jgi:hypothetical protein